MWLFELTCWHSWTEWQILCFTTVTVPSDQWNDMQSDFCTVLLTCCVAAWTDCWLCDSVQKYCCTITSGGFINWFKSNCSQISTPMPVYHCHRQHHHHHHHHNFISSTISLQKDKMCRNFTLYFIYTFSTFNIMSKSALPKIRNVSDKILFIIQNNIFCSVTFFKIMSFLR